MQIKKVKCESTHNKFDTLEGELIMTNYKVVFKPYDIEFGSDGSVSPRKAQQQLKIPSYLQDYLTIPLSYIFKIDKTIIDKKLQKTSFIDLVTKDYRNLKFIFDNFDDCNNALMRIQYLAFLEGDLTNIFAFDFYYPMSQEEAEHELFEDGWDIYRYPIKEFER